MSNTVTRHIKAMAGFGGREARGEFWPFVGFVIATSMILMMCMELKVTFTSDGPPRMGTMTVWVALLAMPIVSVLAAAVVRRLHDCGLSGAWGLLPLPFLAAALFTMYRASTTEFTAGVNSKFDTAFVSAMLYDASLIVLIVLLSRRSDEGANRFGPAPDVR